MTKPIFLIQDQDKIIAQQKNSREALEERKWKQQQAIRQQQQQMQQIIHEQRTQGEVNRDLKIIESSH